MKCQVIVCLVGISVLNSAFAAEPFSSAAASIRAVSPSHSTLGEVADLFTAVTQEVQPRLGPGLKEELERAVKRQVESLIHAASQQLTPDYKSAILEQRVLELSTQIALLPERGLPDAPAERTAAAHQLVSRVEALRAPAGRISAELLGLATELPIAELERSATDLFHRGYGRLLTSEDAAELDRIVASILDDVQETAKGVDSRGPSPQRRMDAARVGVEGQKAIADYLDSLDRKHESAKAFDSRMREWNEQHSRLSDAIAADLSKSTNAEIAAMQALSNQRAEERRVNDSPETIDAQLQKQEQQRRADADKQLAPPPGATRWPFYVLNIGVVIGLVLWSFLKRQRSA